jgi:tRNA 2-selenouridine synthase SelU
VEKSKSLLIKNGKMLNFRNRRLRSNGFNTLKHCLNQSMNQSLKAYVLKNNDYNLLIISIKKIHSEYLIAKYLDDFFTAYDSSLVSWILKL